MADYEQTKETNKIKKRTTNKLADNKIAPRATLPMADKTQTQKNLMVMLSLPKSYSNRKQTI